MKVVLYARVSTRDKGQDNANQILQIESLCGTQGWTITERYQDHESGSKPTRPQFQRMLRDASVKKFDLLIFWSLDRLSREGTLATLRYLELLDSYGVRWRSYTEPFIDSAGPFRDVIISLLASLANQERIRISERVRAGLERAKAGGTKTGRPIGRPRAICRRDLVVELRSLGVSWRQIARQTRTSVGTARRVYRDSLNEPGVPKTHAEVLEQS